jgi:hypothetical protein
MIAPLSLSNVLTVIIALLCLWIIIPQARGGAVKLWRLSVPPILAIVQAVVLLAGDFDASLAHDIEWVVAAILGAAFGRMRGWTLPIDVDRTHDLVRLRPSIDAHVAALGLVVLSAIDFTSATLEAAIVPTEHVASAAALLAGYLGCRALSITVRARRTGRATPPPSTPAETSLPPS